MKTDKEFDRHHTMRNSDIERRRYEWKCGVPDELCTTHICDECGERHRGFLDATKGVFLCLDCCAKINFPDPKGSTLDVADFARL